MNISVIKKNHNGRHFVMTSSKNVSVKFWKILYCIPGMSEKFFQFCFHYVSLSKILKNGKMCFGVIK